MCGAFFCHICALRKRNDTVNELKMQFRQNLNPVAIHNLLDPIQNGVLYEIELTGILYWILFCFAPAAESRTDRLHLSDS